MSPEPARWIKFDPRCYARSLALEEPAFIPLREMGIARAGMDKLQRQFCAATPNSETHLLWFVTNGRIRATSGGQSFLLRTGELFVSPAGKPHTIELASPKARGCWFHLRDNERWQFLRKDEVPQRLSGEGLNLELIMDRMIAETFASRPFRTELMRHLAEIVSFTILREVMAHSTPQNEALRQRLEGLREEVTESPAQEWGIANMARLIHVSPSYLHKITLMFFGTRPMEMVQRIRMDLAKTLLINTSLPLDTIAERIGYGTSYAFSHAFQRSVGIRPGAFRQAALLSQSPGEG